MMRILIGCMLAFHPMAGAQESATEVFGFAFLGITPDAHSYSLGNPVALANGWHMTEWNPAGIGFLDDASLRYDYKDHYAGMSLHAFSAGMGQFSLAKFAVNYRRFTYGTLERSTESGPIETYKPYEDVFSVTVARRVLPWVSIGASIKRVSSELGDVSAHSTLYDAGLMAVIPIELQSEDFQHTFYFGASAGNNLLGDLPVYKTQDDSIQISDSTFTYLLSPPFNVRRNLRAGIGWGVAWIRDYSFQSNLKAIEVLGHVSTESYSTTNVFVSDHRADAGDMELRAGFEVRTLEVFSLRLSTRDLRGSDGSLISRQGVGLRIPFRFFVKNLDVVAAFDYSNTENSTGDYFSFGMTANL